VRLVCVCVCVIQTSGFNKRQENRSREVVNDYGISIRQDPREVGFYKKCAASSHLFRVRVRVRLGLTMSVGLSHDRSLHKVCGHEPTVDGD